MMQTVIVIIAAFIWGGISNELTRRIQKKTSPICWESWVFLYAPILVYVGFVISEKYK